MAFAGINYLAVFLAAVASFVFGAIWYMALSRQWQKAAGLEGRLPGKKGLAAAAKKWPRLYSVKTVLLCLNVRVFGGGRRLVREWRLEIQSL